MMKKLLAVCLLTVSAGAFAGSPYVDGAVGLNTGNNNAAVGVNAGYMFNSFIGAEGGVTGSQNTTMWDGALKGVLPLGLLDLYGKLGMGFVNNGGSTGNGLLYGAGVAFHIAPMFQLHVEDYAVSGNGNPNFLMFGGQFTF